MDKTLFVIVGPTAIGKTAVAIRLAEHFHTEIVSGDSRQFYREMNIGTAKPSPEQLAHVKHHLINSLSVYDEYNAGMFERDALRCIAEIHSKNNRAILCGGSGLYIDIVCRGGDVMPPRDQKIRDELTTLYKSAGIEALRQRLEKLDIEYYSHVDRENPRRLIRALEVCIVTGKTYSELRKGKEAKRPFRIIKAGLELERKKVYELINGRVDEMMENGLLKEAEGLYSVRYLNALQTVGFRELFDYMDNKTSLEEAVELIKQHTRNYAKRQWTWFKRDKTIRWFSPDEFSEVLSYLNER